MRLVFFLIACVAVVACGGGAPAGDRAAETPVAEGAAATVTVVPSSGAVGNATPQGAGASAPAPTATLTASNGATWAPTSAAAGATVGGGTWIRIPAPDGRTILAEVFRPAGQGPWPAVVLLHGQAGFANIHLRAGAEIASNGFVTIVGCWFAGNYDGSSTADPPPLLNNPDGIACPDGPTIKLLRSTAAIDDVATLLAVARALPDVTGRVGLVGYSRGSITAVLTASGAPGSMQAVAALAGVPPVAPTGGPLVQAITAPVLLLQGDADEVLPVQNSRNFEAALRAVGKPVQSNYYPGADHGFFFEARWRSDAMARLVAFLRTTLAP